MDNVILVIDGEEYKASKATLSGYSDYFRAMFSGNYVENEQQRINIDVIDPVIMGIILQYMDIGLIDLSDHSLSTIGDLAVAANFLQITELLQQIRYYLDTQLTMSNFAQIMRIAEAATFMELERLAAVHGLLSFKRMKPAYIPSIRQLYWYLSHPYLDADNEFQVFQFGHEWIMQNERGGDALLLILCCIDYKKLTIHDLKKMVGLLEYNYTNSLAERVIECLRDHADGRKEFFLSYFTKHKSSVCRKYTERVYREVVNLIKSTVNRKLVYTAAVPLRGLKETRPDSIPHSLYTFNKETGFEKWLEVDNNDFWGWSVISWGLTKVVLVCGEYGRGTGAFMRDVKVYDTLRKEWIQHGVILPRRRHAGLVIYEDSLFILGGVGGYRVVLDSVIVYDLNQRTYTRIASLPDAIQNPAVCIHNRELYACGHKNIYKYERQRDLWTTVASTDIHANSIISFQGYIYCTQNYFSYLYRLNPGSVQRLQLVTQFNNPPAKLCLMGDKLVAFTKTVCGHADINAVEEYTKDHKPGERPTVIWAQTYSEKKLDDVAGSCVLVLTIPTIESEVPQYHKYYLEMFPEEYS